MTERGNPCNEQSNDRWERTRHGSEVMRLVQVKRVCRQRRSKREIQREKTEGSSANQANETGL